MEGIRLDAQQKSTRVSTWIPNIISIDRKWRPLSRRGLWLSKDSVFLHTVQQPAAPTDNPPLRQLERSYNLTKILFFIFMENKISTILIFARDFQVPNVKFFFIIFEMIWIFLKRFLYFKIMGRNWTVKKYGGSEKSVILVIFEDLKYDGFDNFFGWIFFKQFHNELNFSLKLKMKKLNLAIHRDVQVFYIKLESTLSYWIIQPTCTSADQFSLILWQKCR